jgi:hypothetical protein
MKLLTFHVPPPGPEFEAWAREKRKAYEAKRAEYREAHPIHDVRSETRTTKGVSPERR